MGETYIILLMFFSKRFFIWQTLLSQPPPAPRQGSWLPGPGSPFPGSQPYSQILETNTQLGFRYFSCPNSISYIQWSLNR